MLAPVDARCYGRVGIGLLPMLVTGQVKTLPGEARITFCHLCASLISSGWLDVYVAPVRRQILRTRANVRSRAVAWRPERLARWNEP